MKKVGTLLTSWLVCASAQIIFPDQFELMQKRRTSPPQAYAPFPTLPSNVNVGFSVNSNVNPERTNVREIDASTILGSSFGGVTNNFDAVPSLNFSQANGVFDAESLYWSNHVNNLIARGVTKFTLDMDRAIYQSNGASQSAEKRNVIFSPLSLVGTLAMVLLGAAGTTFEQVSKILGLEAGVDITAHSEIVHQMFGLLLDSVDAKPNSLGPQATMASGIFVQDGYPIRSEFKAISQHVYKNEVINLDFIGHANQATKSVNDWVKARTRGKISSILSQPVDPDTKLIIASALYFSGEWNQHFLPGATKKKPFAVTPSHSVLVDMMYSGGDFPFYEDKQLGVKIIGLPYKGYDTATSDAVSVKYQAWMYVLLPTSRGIDALSTLENRLTPERIDDMISKMVNQSCIVGLPRMKLSSTLNLNRALELLGLTSLFDPNTSNLGLLSPGYNGQSTNGQPSIFSRFNEGEEEGTGTGTSSKVNPATKKNYFRYEDKRGGYSVEQWNTGVIIEKIHRSLRRRRSEAGGERVEERKATKSTRRQRRRTIRSVSQAPGDALSYELPVNSTNDRVKLKVVPIGKDKYKFDPPASRQKRQGRPIDSDFVRFVESNQRFPKFGLDTLRNSPNLGNPGLFASDVLHKVEMDVTETGTIGAAATSIVLQRGGDVKRLLANRPFLFFIRHEPSRLMLFWGTVNKPTPNY